MYRRIPSPPRGLRSPNPDFPEARLVYRAGYPPSEKTYLNWRSYWLIAQSDTNRSPSTCQPVDTQAAVDKAVVDIPRLLIKLGFIEMLERCPLRFPSTIFSLMMEATKGRRHECGSGGRGLGADNRDRDIGADSAALGRCSRHVFHGFSR